MWGNSGNCGWLFFFELQNHCRWWLQPWHKKMYTPWKESYDQPRQHIKKQRHYFANKGLSSQGYGFSSSHVWMWDLDCKESWALKNWCFWTVVLEKTLESPLDCKEIQPVHPKRDQSWIFTGRTDAEAETPVLWPPNAKNRLIWLMKRPWCWERLRAGWEGDNRWWDGWMVSPTQWTLVWVNSGSWWWTERPGVLQSTDYRVGHDWSTEMNWTEWFWTFFHVLIGYPYICFCDVFIWEVLIKCLNFVIFAADDIIMEELDKDRMCVVCVKLYQLCPTLCDPIDCSLPVSSILGILQARILQWVAMPFSRGSFWPRDWTCVFYVSCIGKQVLYH